MSAKRLSILEISIWIILLVFVLLALSPYAIGYKAKSDYVNLINQLSKISQLDLQVSKYSQGFFSSQASLVLNLPDYPNPILFKEEIVHGPIYLGLISQGKSPLIAAVIKGELDIEAAHFKKNRYIISGVSPLLYQHLIDFNGDVNSQVYVPAINTQIQEGIESVHLESSGAIYTQFLSSANGHVKGEMTAPMLKMQKTHFGMRLEESVISFSGRIGNNQLLIGDTVISVGSINIDSAEEQFAVRKLILHSITSEEGELISSGSQVSAREILASNQKFGPIALNFSFNGLNANDFLRIRKMKIALDSQLKQGVSAETINSMMLTQMMEIMPSLIKQAEVNINPLSINSELGKLEADMEFKLDDIDTNVSMDPLLLLNAINFELNMSIDEPLMKKLIAWNLDNFPENHGSTKIGNVLNVSGNESMSRKVNDNLKAMLGENWLVKNEGVYLSKISMHQGELLINDTQLDAMQQIRSSVNDDTEVLLH